MPPQQVTILELQPQDLPARFEYVGRLEASREIEIRPRITGIIEQRLFDEGSFVTAGQPLFEIDAAPFAARKQAEAAALAEAQARLAQAEREAKRLTPLAKQKTISQRELDDALSNRDLARAAVGIAEAELAEAELELGYTGIKAPFAGRIGRALQVEGALVSPTSGPLAYLARIDPLYAGFSIPENKQLAIDSQLADGSLVMPPSDKTHIKIMLADGTAYPISGQLDFNDYRSDPQTGAFDARATIANPDGRLSPGQFVRVRIEGGIYPQALAVPQRAVLENASGKYVYVAGQDENGTAIAQQKPVEVGQWVELESDAGAERLWVIRSGLSAGDRVIIEGTARIFYPGMPILPQPAGKPGSDTTTDVAPAPPGGDA
jgi:membrane fusion protein (multidrug efflux system)